MRCDGASEQLALVNASRAAGATCGAAVFRPTRALAYDARLEAAATAHAQDMAAGGFGSHTGSTGSTPAQRAAAHGWSALVGENVAAGMDPYEETHAALMASPGHCVNIMHPKATHFGAACAEGRQPYGTYWAQAYGWAKP